MGAELSSGAPRGPLVPGPTGMVGRAEELDRLVAAVTRPPAVVVVEGETGIGKTLLVAELAGRPELAGRLWLTGACVRIREPFPLGPLVGALRGVGDRLAGTPLSPVAGALRPLLPELGEVLPSAPAPLDDRAGERHRVFRGLVEVLAALGDPVLVIEDAHWADEQTIDFLGYLLSQPPPGLSLVVTYRGDEVAPAMRTVAARPAASAAGAHLTLRPLDVAGTRALAAAILGLDRVSDEFTDYLWERTSGLPFAIQELLALLTVRGSLVRVDNRWSRRAIDELTVPGGVRDSVLGRAEQLSPAARAVVDAAAVLQQPVTTAMLAAACRLDRTAALTGVGEALESGLLTEHASPGTVGLRHMLATQAVYESIPLPRRRDLHARAATALRAWSPVPLGQVAYHLRQADDLPAWVDAAEAAADQAIRLGDDAEAAGLLEDVLRTAALSGRRRIELTVKLGWAISAALPIPDVTDLLVAALAADPPQAARGQLRLWYAIVLDGLRVKPELRWQAFVDALEDLGDQPDLAAWAMIALGMPSLPGVPPAEHVVWLERVLDTVPVLTDQTMRELVLGKVAMSFVAIGDPRWSAVADRLGAVTGGRPGNQRAIRAYNSVGEQACLSGHHAEAEQLLSAALEASRALDNPDLEFRCRADLALLDYSRGCWDELEEECAELLAEVSAQPGIVLLLELITACLALPRGDVERTRSALSSVLPLALDRREVDLLPLIVDVALREAIADGRAGGGLDRTRQAVEMWDDKGLWAVGVRALPALVEAMTAAGRQTDAEALVVRVADVLQDRDAPLAPASLSSARGTIAIASGRQDEAVVHLVAAAEAYDGLGCGYEAARARERAAACAVAVGSSDAGAMLRAAMDTYRRLGARWDLDRAAALDPGTQGRRGPRGYGDALSPRELEVSLLVADGLTNKEIAQRLYLSVRTVDKHLSASLRKLGLRSRTALATHIRAESLAT